MVLSRPDRSVTPTTIPSATVPTGKPPCPAEISSCDDDFTGDPARGALALERAGHIGAEDEGEGGPRLHQLCQPGRRGRLRRGHRPLGGDKLWPRAPPGPPR